MKLLPLIVAVAKAQIPDLSSFDLSAFGIGQPGQGTPLNFPAAGDEERYFFTTAVTTTITVTVPTVITTPDGNSCWKCDAMTYATCASSGHYETCSLGDEDCCFVEVREKEQKLAQLCTGCKDATACMDMKGDNFVGTYLNWQCRSDYRLQGIGRHRGQQSVCRQCFKTCLQDDKSTCFGSIDSILSTPNVQLTLNDDETHFEWKTAYGGGNVVAFGIPTHAKLDSSIDSAVIASVEAFLISPETRNIWFSNAADGKVDLSDGANGREATEMTYWGLQGAARLWWESDIKTIQTTLATKLGSVAYAASDFNA